MATGDARTGQRLRDTLGAAESETCHDMEDSQSGLDVRAGTAMYHTASFHVTGVRRVMPVASERPARADAPSILLVHERYRQRAGEDAVFDAELALLRRMGHDVDTLVVDNDAIADDPSLAQRARLALETVWSLRGARLVAKRVDARPVDIVHVHNTFPLLSPSIYGAARRLGAAVVQTLHNYRTICPAATLFRDGQPCEDCVGRAVPWPSVVHACFRDSRVMTLPVAAMVAGLGLRSTWDDVDAFIALTDFAAAKLAEGGLPAERLHVKPNFISPDPGDRLGPGEGFLFAGRLSPEKGIGTIIDAAPLLEPGVVVRVAGDGPETDRLLAAAATCPSLQPRGRLTRERVAEELRATRALVFPSLWYEGLPMTILEAFASGVPVIAARRGAAATLVTDGVTGLTFAPGDAAELASRLAWAHAHPDEMAGFGRAARAVYLERYTEEATYDRLAEIYRIAMARRRGSGDGTDRRTWMAAS
jgi:glycosyltransferase involved in cell wall biosynthesis